MSRIPKPSLSAIEQYLFIDSRPSYPLDFFYRLKFDGALDETRLSEAFYCALQQHPLLRSTIARRGRKYEWVICDERPEFSVEHPTPQTPILRPSAIDLTQKPGSRLYVYVEPQETTLMFQFHHTATDGLGAMGFVNDVLQLYSGAISPEEAAASRDINRLAERHSCGYQSTPLLERIRKLLHVIYMSRLFLGCRVSPLSAHCPNVEQSRTPDDAFRDIHEKLTVEETAAVKRIAKEQGVSSNTVLIRDAFVALENVRRNFDGYDPNDFIRIAVPGNLRSPPSNDGFPAANFFSLTFPARNTPLISDSAELLQTVHGEIRAARTHYYFATFILGLKITRMIPGGLERMLHQDKCQTSLLLTNVGTVLSDFPGQSNTQEVVLDGATLRTVELVAPLRPYQSISLATLQYAGQQTITMSYDPRIHSDEEASHILQTYLQELRSYL